MNPDINNRKGARKVEDIPSEVMSLINLGEIETVNLTEWLAVDHMKLIEAVFPLLGIEQDKVQQITKAVAAQKKPSAMSTTKLIGSKVYALYALAKERGQILNALSTHRADSIRCYAPYLIGLNETLSIKEKLNQARLLIADQHFGVREVVWMALRPEIDNHIDESISILSGWTSSEDENIRRFTTESTRPRGVWCKHIEVLKEEPERALPILTPLRSDPSKYVQDSVGNWLNDASKSRPDFVVELCEQWLKESPTKETTKIVKRAKRTIDKK